MIPVRPRGQVLMALGAAVFVLVILYIIWSLGSGFCVQDPKPCDCSNSNVPSEKDTLYAQLLTRILQRVEDKSTPLLSLNMNYGGEAADQGDISAGKVVQAPEPAPGGFVPLKPFQVHDPSKQAGVDKEVYDKFQSALNEDEREMIFGAFVRLSQTALEKGFTYMMYSGTLLGSYRHHDMVPWVEVLDVFMNYTQKAQIIEALKRQGPKYQVFVAGARVKFYSSQGGQTSSYAWKWPYIDVSFFKENATHIWDGSMEDDYGDRKYVYPKERVFPLHLRPLGGHFFYAPRDSYANLRNTYDRSTMLECATPYYSHKNEALSPGVAHKPCRDLRGFVPFVHRSPDENGVRETLMKANKIVHTLVVGEPKYALTKPYKIELT